MQTQSLRFCLTNLIILQFFAKQNSSVISKLKKVSKTNKWKLIKLLNQKKKKTLIKINQNGVELSVLMFLFFIFISTKSLGLLVIVISTMNLFYNTRLQPSFTENTAITYKNYNKRNNLNTVKN